MTSNTGISAEDKAVQLMTNAAYSTVYVGDLIERDGHLQEAYDIEMRAAYRAILSSGEVILKADVEALVLALRDVTEELASEIEDRYAPTKDHPAMKRRYDRDMDSVIKSRFILTKFTTKQEQL